MRNEVLGCFNEDCYSYQNASIKNRRKSIKRSTPAVTEDGVPIRKLLIGNLAEQTSYRDLADLFSKYGTLKSCYLRMNQGRNKYGFVTFRNVTDAMKAVQDGRDRRISLHGRYVRVMPADSWHQPDNMENKYWNLSCKECDQDYLQCDITVTSIHKLNDDCLMHIFCYLPIVDRVRIERVCKHWKAVSQESWCTLKRLDLSHSTWGFPLTSKQRDIKTVMLRKVLLRCGRFLNEINLSHTSHSLNQSTLTVISKLCPNLQTIDVTALVISASGICSLTSNCHNIVSFSIGRSTRICDTDLKQLFAGNPKLQYLKVVANTMSGECLSHLPVNAIEEVILERCQDIQERYLVEALTKFEKLRSLSFQRCAWHMYNVMETIGMHFKTLKSLEISGVYELISSANMIHITQLTNLETLNLSWNFAVTDRLLIQLTTKCLQLIDVNISGCRCVRSVGLTAITTLPKLEKLKISHLKLSVNFQDMYNLKELECRKCIFVSDEEVANLIKYAPLLEVLDLSGCVSIRNDSLENAVIATNSRTNNVVLKIFIGGTSIQLSTFHPISPLLQIVNIDLS